MNVVIYARYSSSSQREASIEEQIKTCTEYAKRKKYTIVGYYKDNAMTGKNDQRPELQKLLKDSLNGFFGAVIVYSVDRFGRNLIQTLTNEKKLNNNNVVLYSATESFTDDPSGRFFKNMMMAQAQYYSDELSEKIKRGMDYNAQKCLCTGGNIALGYKVTTDKHFEVDNNTSPIVQTIFKMYAEGKTVTEIITHLNSLGYKTSRGVAFNKNSLHSILNNKRYTGVYTYKGEEYPDSIPRIISDELFNKVAEMMNKNKKAPARSRAKVEYLLTTKLFCGHCKEMMTGFSGTGKQGKIYRYYICNGTKKKSCNKKRVSKEYIEDIVVSQCRKLLTPTNIKRIAKEVNSICEAERDTSNLRFLQKSMADNEYKKQNALNAILETDDTYIRKNLYEMIKQLESEKEMLEKEIAKEVAPFPLLTQDKIMFFLTSLSKGNINDIKYRKMLISIFVNKIFLYDDRITITFNSGDDKVTINDRLLSELEEKDANMKVLFIDGDAPPNGHWTNTYYFRGGFAVKVML